VRVLLTEGSSLTSREVVTCLGPTGCWLEVLDPNGWCLARASRWVAKVHRCPPAEVNPLGYLDFLEKVVAEREIDVVLPTHEQAWLLAASHRRLSPGLPLAVADAAAFDRVQSKVQFADLLDELEMPQPGWRLIREEHDVVDLAFPYWLKSAFSTAGQGVREITDERSRTEALSDLLGDASAPLMAQQPARGHYGQVQGLFDRGRLVAVHTSMQVRTGMGGSAAARISVEDPGACEDIARLGEALGWHGGLTLDYMSEHGTRQYIECNPRTVEPGNAAASGVNIPELQVLLTLGEQLSSPPRMGRPGVRTHGTIALLLGVASRRPSRRAALAELGRAITRRGCYRGSKEQLTPIIRDPPSLGALGFVIARLLASPEHATDVARRAISSYSITPESVAAVTNATGGAIA
jgi:hypothetical protein